MRTTAAALLLLASSVAAEVRYASFTSPSLGREVRYAVDLPASYASGSGTYPVLYALHGLFESAQFWETRGLAEILQGLRERGDVPEFLVVAVDGGNSFFVNTSGGRYEDLVTRDLIAHVESTYRVVPGREGRALLGVSMGGYAALRIAFAHPDLYRSVATHSAMLLEKPPTREEGAGRWQMGAFNQVFGDPIDPERWAAADPLAWADKVDPRSAPALYFDCGSEDRYGLFAGNEDLHRRLLARDIAHTFALNPGNHGYEYVRSVLDRSLRFTGEALRAGAAASARAAITIRTASAPPLKVFYLNIPWGPNTFAAMEKGGDSFYAKRTWPFARLEATAPFTLEKTKVPPGNYALVFHPNTPDNKGMSLEVRKIGVAEFLEPGNVMTRTPEGESFWRARIRFDTTAETSRELKVELAPLKGRVALIVRYGDRRLVEELAY